MDDYRLLLVLSLLAFVFITVQACSFDSKGALSGAAAGAGVGTAVGGPMGAAVGVAAGSLVGGLEKKKDTRDTDNPGKEE